MVIIDNMKRLHKQTLSSLMAISFATIGLLGTCPLAFQPLEKKVSSVLRVITTPSINTYFETANGPDGMEFQLIKSFAEQQHLTLEIILTTNVDAIYSTLDEGLADIAITGQPISATKQNTYQQSPSYRQVSTVLSGRHLNRATFSQQDMANKIIVAQDTESNRFKYRQLKAFNPNITWQFSKERPNALFDKVNSGKFDYLVTDSLTFALKHPRYPSLIRSNELFAPENVAIIYSHLTSPAIKASLNSYINDIKATGELAVLMERYYGHTADVDNSGYRSFSFLMRNRLPSLEYDFRRVAQQYKLDWRLLAAVAYQESHWDAEAISRTGVRGLMMLTNDTATEMGVVDRENPTESLNGGAKYLRKILRELPKTIEEPDRTWFALAAYNIGMGHLVDAIKLTESQHKNPNTWLDVKQHLPLLTQKAWFSQTRYGYARGKEPVKYVQNIRRYYDILAWRYPVDYSQHRSSQNSLMVMSLEDAIQHTHASTHNEAELHVSGLLR